jgi:hydroxymethylglutaryl-CoA synthase
MYCLPSYYVDQRKLAKHLNINEDKITRGLGLVQMGVPSLKEDPISAAMTVVRRIMDEYKIGPSDVGRLEVGTESNHDGSKSIKSYLMGLFDGNCEICGCDSVSACYGGTNALFNALCWMESSMWDGRYAIVVCTDISMYKEESAIPTSGAGAVAILLGPDPVFVFKREYFSHYFTNEFDFMKPRDTFPFPVIKGKASIDSYLTAFAKNYSTLRERLGEELRYDYLCCHSPYARLPKKACSVAGIPVEKVCKSLLAVERNGNSYTSSLYFGLISLLYNTRHSASSGERILLFSFGSGSASSMFCIERVRVASLINDFEADLDMRKEMEPSEYMRRMQEGVNLENYEPICDFIGEERYFLDRVSNYVRTYSYNGRK